MRRHGCDRSIIDSPLNSRRGINFYLLLRSFALAIFVSMVSSTSSPGQFHDNDAAELETKTFVSRDGAKTGDFSSPGFPNPYPENARTRFHFRAAPEEVVWITWGTFVLEGPFSANGLCMRDYVEVIVIDYHNVQHVSGRYCGVNKPPDFKTMQQSVDIIFQSSYTKHFQGFNGTYTFIHESELRPPDSRYMGKTNPHAHGCGGLAKGKYGGIIQSPGYPETFPGNVECNWVIRVDPGKKVYVRILELQLSPSKTDCAEAHLSVIDGYAHYIYENNTTPHEKHMVRFCGEDKYYKEEGARSYMSTRNRMVVRFNTTQPPHKQMVARREEYGSPIGFYLVWTEVLPVDEKDEKQSQCDKFLCRGGDYCLDETQTVCAERRRYCIDKSLLCDGIPNCAELDESDEENCYSKEIVAAGASLFLLLVLIIVAVICCQRRRGRKQVQHIRRAAANSARPVNATPLNAVNNVNALSSEDTQLLRASTINKLEANSVGQRNADITAFPQNYHPVRAAAPSIDDDLMLQRQPFLAVPNHVSTPAAVGRIGVDSAGRKEKVVALRPEDIMERSLSSSSETGSILRRRQGGGHGAAARIPLIKVMSAPEGGGAQVWEEQGDLGGGGDCSGSAYSDQQRHIQKRGDVDNSTVTWSYEPSSKPLAYPPPVPYDATRPGRSGIGDSGPAGVGSVEMVTFSTMSKPVSTATHRTQIKPQGILKMSSSLPASGDEKEARSIVPEPGTSHPVGKKVSVPAPPPPPQVPSAENTSKPPPPSYSQALARLGRQKAVEFAEELPRRHNGSQQQQQSALPQLTLNAPGAVLAVDAVAGEDRSPSPWHRLKPSMV